MYVNIKTVVLYKIPALVTTKAAFLMQTLPFRQLVRFQHSGERTKIVEKFD